MTGTDPLRTAIDLDRALADGDLDRVGTAAKRLANDATDPSTTASALGEAVDRGEDGAARALARELQLEYDRRASDEGRAVERSSVARRQSGLATSTKQTLSDHVKTAGSAAAERGGLLVNVATLLGSERADGAVPEAPDRSTVVASATRLSDTETSFERAQGAGRTAAKAVDVPASPAIAATRVDPTPVVIDEAAALQVTVANVGDEAVNGVRVSATPDPTVEVSPARRILGGIGPESAVTATFVVRATELGDRRVNLAVSADDVDDTLGRATFGVAERPPIERVLDRNDDGRIDTSEFQAAVAHWHADDPVPGTDGVRLTDDAVRRVARIWANDLPVGRR